MSKRFQGQEAQQYDEGMERLIPGYSLVSTLTAAYFKTCLPEHAHILVVGAGTCEEVLTLAQAHTNWQFTATDISADMLAVGEQKIQAHQLQSRVRLVHGTVGELMQRDGFSHESYDAATLLWVMHFVMHEQKVSFLTEISQILKPNAPFVVADLMQADDPLLTDVQIETCRLMGVPDERLAQMKTRYEQDFYPLNTQDLAVLCKNVGWQLKGTLFTSPRFQCHFG